MARPIKETPVLTGKDAQRFAEKIAVNESKKVSRAEYEKVMANYNKIRKNAKLD